MNRASGAVLIVLGLLILYMGITDKFKCFAHFWECLASGADCECGASKVTASLAPPPLSIPKVDSLAMLRKYGVAV